MSCWKAPTDGCTSRWNPKRTSSCPPGASTRRRDTHGRPNSASTPQWRSSRASPTLCTAPGHGPKRPSCGASRPATGGPCGWLGRERAALPPDETAYLSRESSLAETPIHRWAVQVSVPLTEKRHRWIWNASIDEAAPPAALTGFINALTDPAPLPPLGGAGTAARLRLPQLPPQPRHTGTAPPAASAAPRSRSTHRHRLARAATTRTRSPQETPLTPGACTPRPYAQAGARVRR